MLFIKLEQVKEFLTSVYFNDLPHFSICNAEIEPVDEQQLLVISSCMGGDVEITFLGELTFLALNCDRKVLNT